MSKDLIEALYQADAAFVLALKKQFGQKIHIGDYRYGQKSFNEETKKAAKAYDAASQAYSNWCENHK